MKNLYLSFFASPLTQWKHWGIWLVLYGSAALGIGIATNLFQLQFLDLRRFWFLPITLLVFPCLLEELFFRGVLINRDVLDKGHKQALMQIGFSALAFTLWHPLNAWTINKSAQPFFFNPWFLIIVFLLGLICGYSYVRSRSLWTPILIHWLTVLIWVIGLGGRNLVLQ